MINGVNPEILKWARKRAGYTVEDVAKILKKKVGEIEKWERGKSIPTYIQLEKLAYRVYKRPLALFFFPKAPDETDPVKAFRTLPDFELESLIANTRFLIRQAEAMQIALWELNDGENKADKKIFKDLRLFQNDTVEESAKVIRDYLKVELEEQVSWKKNDVALEQWRKIIEDNGIYVFKNSFKQKDISGFCLLDKQFPVIYLNNSNSYSRQIFTLFHELSHILLELNGFTKTKDDYINTLVGIEKEKEIFSNKLTSEILVPNSDFNRYFNPNDWDEKTIESLARRYCVSREVILRKILDRGLITGNFYAQRVDEWIKVSKRGGNGGNYYLTQAAYLGENYMRLSFGNYYKGKISLNQLADYLNVKVKSVNGLEQVLFSKGYSF
ncbi:MAG: ImmA/IrrE family metallo-endopeptidase [Promethearchaeota archaeon]|jgi:Zn-dependent peptidase ImmA (M78 family)